MTGENTEEKIDPAKDSGDNLVDIINEEVDETAVDDGKAEINAADFSVGEEEVNADPGAAAQQEQEPPPNAKDPAQDPPKQPEKEIPPGDKDAAVKRLFKPGTVILFYNMVARRVGVVAKPEYPEIIQLHAEDQKDITILLKETAEEENWQAVPAKYLLLVIMAMKALETYFIWNKPHLWPKNKQQQIEKKNDSEKEKELMLAREKARADAEQNNHQLKDTIENLRDMIRQQADQINMLMKNYSQPNPASREVTDVDFEEIPSRYYKNFDMEIISFRDSGVITDPTKMGLPGYDESGMKIGRPTKEMMEVYDHWKKYMKHKKKAA